MWAPVLARGVARRFAAPMAPMAFSARWSSHVTMIVTEVRKGMILLHQDQFWEVKEWAPAKQGRGAASYAITYDELDTGKEKTQKFGSGQKMIRVEPDKVECQVMYHVGEGAVEDRRVVLADEDFNEIEIPYPRFTKDQPKTLEEGTKVVLLKDDERIVKVYAARG